MQSAIHTIGMIAAIVLPFWNIPLILTIHRRRSSQDISLAWALGVFVCILAMLPSAIGSPDRIFQAFSLINTVFFAAVVLCVLKYR